MTDHTSPRNEEASEAEFYPVDGMRGHCSCGNYMNYIGFEGEATCDECGRVWNVYVDCDLWEEP